jgi:hypothetical protein
VSFTSEARQRLSVAALTVGLIGGLAGASAYSFATIGESHDGGMAIVGPAQDDRHHHGGWGQDVDNAQLDTMLRNTHTDWSAAINRSSPAAGLELSTDTAVMAIGGFGGIDPAPTLSEFQQDVANHRITYYVEYDQKPRPGGFDRPSHTDIAKWVADNFTPMKVGSDTVFDLTAPLR